MLRWESKTPMSRKAPATIALEDRLLAVLRDEGPSSTSQLRQATAPHYETREINHGAWGYDCNETRVWMSCPGCDCTVTRDASRWVGSKIRTCLLRLERTGLVVRISSPNPQATGGDWWFYVIGDTNE